MDMGDLGKAYDGVVRLALVGIAALVTLTIGAIVGVPLLAWWAWHHISIH